MNFGYKPFFVVNPEAQNGQLGKDWPAIKSYIENELGSFDFKFTKRALDTTLLTRQALKEGYTLIVAVGGDGTLSGCLNGFFENNKLVSKKAVLGILPYGRGSDFARALGISRDFKESLINLRGKRVCAVDVGLGSYINKKGKSEDRFFLNIANVGLVSHVDNWSHRAPKMIGASGAYIYGTVRGLMEYRSHEIKYESEEKRGAILPVNIVIANGPYFGAGMKAAPKAKIDDGKLDIVMMKQTNFAELLYHFPKMYTGKILKAPNVAHLQTKKIKFTDKGTLTGLSVEMDGDDVGTTPATFQILEKTIQFKI